LTFPKKTSHFDNHIGYHELTTIAPSLFESTTSMAWNNLFSPTCWELDCKNNIA